MAKKMRKLIVFIIGFILLLNNLSAFSFFLTDESQILSSAVIAEIPVIGVFAMSSLPMKAFEVLADKFNISKKAGDKKTDNRAKKGKNTSADLAIISLENGQSKILKAISPISNIFIHFISNVSQILRIDARGSPPARAVNIIILFLLFYLVLLSRGNLPYRRAKNFCIEHLTRLSEKGRVFHFKKVVAVFTVSCFLFSFVVRDALLGAAYVNPLSKTIDKIDQDQGELLIPSILGRITSSQDLKSSKVIINIQDLHCNGEVQRNISGILKALDQKYNLKKVFVEGASGEVDTSWLCGIKDEKFKKEVLETLINEGKLTGTEYYSVTNNRPKLLYGLEKEAPYDENFKRLNQILENQSRYSKVIENLKREAETLKNKYSNSQQKRIENMSIKYKQGKIETSKYYSLLGKYADKINANKAFYKSGP